MNIFRKLEKENFLIIQLLFLTCLFPITYLLGNSIINLFLLLISITYLIFIFKKKIFFDFKDCSFLSLILLWITFLVNLFFSQDPSLSMNRVLKFFFIIFFISAIKYIIKYKNYLFEKFIFKTWSIIFLIVFFDLIVEYFLGHNLTGNTSYMPGRLTSFIGDELVVGYFYIGFALFAFIYFHQQVENKKYNYLLLILLVAVSFLIGERSNFIKFFLTAFIFFFVAYELNIKKKILGLIITIIIIISLIYGGINYKTRFIHQMPNIFEKNGIKKFMLNSTYGSHFNTGINVFKKNYIFGVGIKNYREESIKKIYTKQNKDFAFQIMGTHPHQIHFEILAETGLFGFLSFITFILYSLFYSLKSYFKNKNKYQLSAILFILCSLIPFLPSGSFFSTYTSILFWLNFAIMTVYNNNKI